VVDPRGVLHDSNNPDVPFFTSRITRSVVPSVRFDRTSIHSQRIDGRVISDAAQEHTIAFADGPVRDRRHQNRLRSDLDRARAARIDAGGDLVLEERAT
jgi:hypothetical protein